MSNIPAPMTGNTLNAAGAVDKHELATARATILAPLRTHPDDPIEGQLEAAPRGQELGFVLLHGVIYLAKVLSIYSRSGGKNGKHGWVEAILCIAVASHIVVQASEHLYNRQFHAVPQSLQFAGVHTIANKAMGSGRRKAATEGLDGNDKIEY
ncbi:hypothetical protein BD779DRAFT_1479280 [Infundibulicybe gibba]|nr:hypothetical protein BD779DRAFT_1479280 [Infundibulicybe gibba]